MLSGMTALFSELFERLLKGCTVNVLPGKLAVNVVRRGLFQSFSSPRRARDRHCGGGGGWEGVVGLKG